MNDRPDSSSPAPGAGPDVDDEAALDAALAASQPLAANLAQLFEVPADLRRRTTAEVTDGLLARSSLSAAVDLVALGWRTVRLLAAPPAPPTPPTDSEEGSP